MTIEIINLAKAPLGVDLDALIAVLQIYVDETIVPVWGPGTRATLLKADSVPASGWSLVFLDDADQAGALGYHDVNAAGEPIAKVFVRTALENGEIPSVTASHELVEMLVDPGCQQMAQSAQGVIYAYEPADPVEETSFQISGISVSNFVTPDWFKTAPTPGAKFDLLGKVAAQFQIAAGGYIPVYDPTNGQWTQVFGSFGKSRRFGKEDRRGHRAGSRRRIASPHDHFYRAHSPGGGPGALLAH